jgi:hypothetical protein
LAWSEHQLSFARSIRPVSSMVMTSISSVTMRSSSLVFRTDPEAVSWLRAVLVSSGPVSV